jgi:acyl-coenzyme A thioesterase PaaI-like protein
VRVQGRVRHVVVGGRVVVEDGRLVAEDMDSIVATARHEAARLWDRMATIS